MAGAPARTLVIDESLDRRLAPELTRRGRRATGASALGLTGCSDLDLVRALDARFGSWVLVTADDQLPGNQAGALRGRSGAVATINPDADPAWPLGAYRGEVVHRWAHAMHAQEAGTMRRYGLRNQSAWRPRAQRPRMR